MLPEKLQGKVVSATAFVRNFGAYARNAGAEPIHILNHGRPAWSLVTTEQLERLAEAQSGPSGSESDRLTLNKVLESIHTSVIVVDRQLRIVRINSLGRKGLNVENEDAIGVPLARLLTDQRFSFILRAVERVRDTGINEELDVDTFTVPVHSYHMKIEQFPEGIAILSEDVTAQALARERYSAASIYEELMDALPGLARGTINARSVIVSASTALSHLVQTDADRIVGMRLTSLFHATVRGEVTDAVEALLADRKPFTLDTSLQTGGMNTMAVTLSATPNPLHGNDDGAIFLLQKQAN